MRPLAAIVILVALAAGLPACGEDEGGSGDGADLAAMLPAGPGAIAFADFAAARDAAGLPEDADFAAAKAEGGGEGRRFAQEAASVLVPLNQSGTALAKALDGSQVQAAASDGTITLVRTDQEFEELASAVDGSGGPAIVEGEEGLIGVGEDRQLVERILAREGEAEGIQGTLVEEIGDLPIGAVLASGSPTGCLSGVAIGDEIEEGAGLLVLNVEGGADPESFLLSKAPGAAGLSPYAVFEFEEPEADGELLRIPFSYPVEEGGAPLVLVQAAVLPDQDFYACRGVGAD
jgi:hypothetical protein